MQPVWHFLDGVPRITNAVIGAITSSPTQVDISTPTNWARFDDTNTSLVIGSGYGLSFGASVSTPDWKLSRGAANRADMDSGDSLRAVSGFFDITAGSYRLGNVIAFATTAPAIASGFGTSPSIVASNGTAAFTVNVGTGGTASNGVITMPTATNGWIAHVENLTGTLGNYANQRTVQIASTTTSITVENQTISTGAALAWTASDVLVVTCVAY